MRIDSPMSRRAVVRRRSRTSGDLADLGEDAMTWHWPRASIRRKAAALLEDNIVNLVDEEYYPRSEKRSRRSHEDIEQVSSPSPLSRRPAARSWCIDPRAHRKAHY